MNQTNIPNPELKNSKGSKFTIIITIITIVFLLFVAAKKFDNISMLFTPTETT